MKDPQIVKHGEEWYLIIEKKGDIELTPLDPNIAYTVKDKTDNARTVKQNASMHKYFAKVAFFLNDGGFSVQKVVALFKKAEISWTMLGVKDVIWRNIQVALTKKESTTTLNTDELTKVYNHVDHYLSNNVGIEHIPFPSIDSMIFEQNYKEK